ncbi:hypothetical protein RRG08_059970 [Elysia crispata]|uniref:Uncharacterized protein n=1 Tax=Elysia crispata TaxID=231223 RepID=A0AAE1DQV5_9GAST|nr:hypothetical protein RRG08_059970 [Elysia crispata]
MYPGFIASNLNINDSSELCIQASSPLISTSTTLQSYHFKHQGNAETFPLLFVYHFKHQGNAETFPLLFVYHFKHQGNAETFHRKGGKKMPCEVYTGKVSVCPATLFPRLPMGGETSALSLDPPEMAETHGSCFFLESNPEQGSKLIHLGRGAVKVSQTHDL